MKSPYPVLLSLLLTAGCSNNPPGPATEPVAEARVSVPTPVEAAPSTPVLSDHTMARVLFLFDQADAAMAARRLTSPAGASAWDHYREILDRVPDNKEAERGLVNIVERYIQWSDAALRQGRLERARLYLERAARVKPDHPPLRARLTRLERQPVTRDRYVALDRVQLEERSPAIQGQLATLAEEIRHRNARVVIEAPSDRQGRWIYQQLNSQHETYRIRANLRLEPQPGLRLVY